MNKRISSEQLRVSIELNVQISDGEESHEILFSAAECRYCWDYTSIVKKILDHLYL